MSIFFETLRACGHLECCHYNFTIKANTTSSCSPALRLRGQLKTTWIAEEKTKFVNYCAMIQYHFAYSQTNCRPAYVTGAAIFITSAAAGPGRESIIR